VGEGARRFRLALRARARALACVRSRSGWSPEHWLAMVRHRFVLHREGTPQGAPPTRRTSRNRCARVLVTVCALAGIAHGPAAAQPSADATLACGAAATRAERDWHLPSGLLAAIGTIESGRRAPTGLVPTIWPWTINAEGRGFYQPSKAAAIDMVRILLLRGARLIDVGCFQVDLFYHPYAFANLEAAFDPDANAGAAARILSLGRLGSTGWDGAIAAYHSALPRSVRRICRRFVPSGPGSWRIRPGTSRRRPGISLCCSRHRRGLCAWLRRTPLFRRSPSHCRVFSPPAGQASTHLKQPSNAASAGGGIAVRAIAHRRRTPSLAANDGT